MKNFIAFCIISFALLCTALFGFLFAHCIKSYAEFNYDYTELHCRELTFTGYEADHYYKTGTSYMFYFEESDEPLVINNITSKKLDKKALTALEEGQALKVYTPQDDPNDICELSTDSVTLLHLSDYNNVNRSNQTIGMILCPIMILGSIFSAVYFLTMLKFNFPKKKGRGLMLEYETDGNVIGVFESDELSSLTFNNRPLDQCRGLIGKGFHLKGSCHSKGKRITAEAKVEHMTLQLYCNGELVKTKYIVRR